MERQKRIIKTTMFIPMDFPSDWDKEQIEFYLNESSWCWSNIIDILKKFDDNHGCICSICEGETASEDEVSEHSWLLNNN